MELQKLEKEFKQGLKRGREEAARIEKEKEAGNTEEKVKDAEDLFTVDYPIINSLFKEVIFPSYKEGYAIGLIDFDSECGDTQLYLSWVTHDAIKNMENGS
jgi:hypothetical protein